MKKKLDIANLTGRSQYSSPEFEKMRREIQECGKYRPCRIFIKNNLAVEIAMSYVKTHTLIFRDKFGVNQHDKVLRKQQSLGLRLKKNFPNKDMLLVKIDEKGHVDRDPDYERKRQKELERLGYHLIRINPNKIDFNIMKNFLEYKSRLMNQLKDKLKNH